jgi:hypothetical protein
MSAEYCIYHSARAWKKHYRTIAARTVLLITLNLVFPSIFKLAHFILRRLLARLATNAAADFFWP